MQPLATEKLNSHGLGKLLPGMRAVTRCVLSGMLAAERHDLALVVGLDGLLMSSPELFL